MCLFKSGFRCSVDKYCLISLLLETFCALEHIVLIFFTERQTQITPEAVWFRDPEELHHVAI